MSLRLPRMPPSPTKTTKSRAKTGKAPAGRRLGGYTAVSGHAPCLSSQTTANPPMPPSLALHLTARARRILGATHPTRSDTEPPSEPSEPPATSTAAAAATSSTSPPRRSSSLSPMKRSTAPAAAPAPGPGPGPGPYPSQSPSPSKRSGGPGLSPNPSYSPSKRSGGPGPSPSPSPTKRATASSNSPSKRSTATSMALSGLRFRIGGQLPATALPTRLHLCDDSSPSYGSESSHFDKRTGRLRRQVFPSSNPASRRDSEFLHEVLDKLLDEFDTHGTVMPDVVAATSTSPNRHVGGHAYKMGMGLLDIVTHGQASAQAGTSAAVVAQAVAQSPTSGGPSFPAFASPTAAAASASSAPSGSALSTTTTTSPTSSQPGFLTAAPSVLSSSYAADVQASLRTVAATFGSPPNQDLPVWELILYELVRQVFVSCEERGVLLERVRTRFLDARHDFDRMWASSRLYCEQVAVAHHTLKQTTDTAVRRAEEAEADREFAASQLNAARQEMAAATSARAAVLAERDRLAVDKEALTLKLERAKERVATMQAAMEDMRQELEEARETMHHQDMMLEEMGTSVARASPVPRAAGGSGGSGGSGGVGGSDGGGTAGAESSSAADGAADFDITITPVSPSFGRGFASPSHSQLSGGRLSGRSPNPSGTGRRSSKLGSPSPSGRSSRGMGSPSALRRAGAGGDDGDNDDGDHTQLDRYGNPLPTSGDDPDAGRDGALSPTGRRRIVSSKPGHGGTRGGTSPSSHDGADSESDDDAADASGDSDDSGNNASRRHGRKSQPKKSTGTGGDSRAKSRKGGRRRKRVGRLSDLRDDDDDDDDDAGRDAHSLMLDQSELQQRRLGEMLMAPRLTKLEKRDRFRERFKVPLSWRPFVDMDDAGHVRRGAARVMTIHRVHSMLWQLLVEKLQSDTKNQRDGLPPDGMPDFVANHLLFNFGTRALVQERLTLFIISLEEHAAEDRLACLCARFCSLVDGVPLAAVTCCLEALRLTYDNKPPMPGSMSHSKPFDVTFGLHKGLRAIQSVSTSLRNANPRLATERLIAYSTFPNKGATRCLASLDQWMKHQAAMEAEAKAAEAASVMCVEPPSPPGEGASSLDAVGGGVDVMASVSSTDASSDGGVLLPPPAPVTKATVTKATRSRPSSRVTFAGSSSGGGGGGGGGGGSGAGPTTGPGSRLSTVQSSHRKRRYNQHAPVDVVDLIEVVLDMWQQSVDSAETHLSDLFNACDKNGNGILDFDEFQEVLKKFAASYHPSSTLGARPPTPAEAEDPTVGGLDGSGARPSTPGADRVGDDTTSRRLFMECVRRVPSGKITIDVFVTVVQSHLADALQKEFEMNKTFLRGLVGGGGGGAGDTPTGATTTMPVFP